MAVSTAAAALLAAGLIGGGAVAKNQMNVMEGNAEKQAERQAGEMMSKMPKPSNIQSMDSKQVRDARNMRLLNLSQRSGRESTFLSQSTTGGNKMGG